ncbi:MAG: DUF262 domain-containing protein, partial [Pseudomonadota bacterium]
VEIREEEEDSYTNEDLFKIHSWGADLSFRELITMYEEEELVKPELQRKYVWDKPEASRFVDSLLLGLPVPSIFLASTQDKQKLIIDGYQRIMTVYDFVRGVWSKDNRVFKLSNTDKIHERWRGKAFSELKEHEQRKIRSTTIHAIVFEQQSPDDGNSSLFQIFERINTSGRSLKSQEIRNCVYQGPINSLLFELNRDPDWRSLFGVKAYDSRMRDMEFILRFMALGTDDIWEIGDPAHRISLKKHLNDFMGDPVNEGKVDSLRRDFLETIGFVRARIGEDAFFNVQQSDPTKIRKRFYPTIFDSIAIATLLARRKLGDDIPTRRLEQKRRKLIKSEQFKSYISEATMRVEHITGRINFAAESLYGVSIAE